MAEPYQPVLSLYSLQLFMNQVQDWHQSWGALFSFNKQCCSSSSLHSQPEEQWPQHLSRRCSVSYFPYFCEDNQNNPTEQTQLLILFCSKSKLCLFLLLIFLKSVSHLSVWRLFLVQSKGGRSFCCWPPLTQWYIDFLVRREAHPCSTSPLDQ